MRGLTAVLFLFGCFWAFLALFLISTPIGIFLPRYEYRAHDVICSLIASATSALGYFVWFGWFFFAVKGRFPLVQWRSFWLLSLLQHCAWLLVLPYLREENIVAFIWSTELLVPKIWILGNVLLAFFCVLAQPGARLNGDSAEPLSYSGGRG